jgi:uncharacterized protein (TIGR00251 family)
LTLQVKVVTRSSKSEVVGELAEGTLKVRLAAVPEKGKANAELCQILAKHFKVAPSAVTILKGHTSAIKLVRIDLPE